MKNSLYKKGIVFGIIVLFIGVSFAGSPLGFSINKSQTFTFDGNILYVGGSGEGNYSTIQEAVDNASDGDTVFVFDDSSPYYENVIVDKSINLVGEDKNTTIIDGNMSGDVVYVTDDWVNISGFTIQHSGGEWTAGISILSNYNMITGNILTKNDIYLDHADYNTIIENTVINGRYGIHLRKSADNNFIVNNVITKCAGHGMLLVSNSHNTITGNTIADNGGCGIMLSSANGQIVSENDISSNKRQGIWVFASDSNIISGNNISKNRMSGIGADSEHTTISDNNISDNNMAGIHIRAGSKNIYGNTISNNLGRGIYCEYAYDTVISNNIIFNNEGGLYMGPLAYDNIVSDNSFFNEGVFIDSSYRSTYSNNMVNGKPLVYLEDISNKEISGSLGQLILVNCHDISIRNLHISDTDVGIELLNSDNCIISQNLITNNKFYGIYIKGNNNIIYRNNLKNNSNGIYWDGVSNSVKQNNFIGNSHNARFNIDPNGGWSTSWIRNFWDKPRIFPIAISGTKDVKFEGLDIVIKISWVGFDWRPAKEPYTIV